MINTGKEWDFMDNKDLNKEVIQSEKLLNKIIIDLENEIEDLSHIHFSLSSQISCLGLINIQSDLIKLTDKIEHIKQLIND